MSEGLARITGLDVSRMDEATARQLHRAARAYAAVVRRSAARIGGPDDSRSLRRQTLMSVAVSEVGMVLLQEMAIAVLPRSEADVGDMGRRSEDLFVDVASGMACGCAKTLNLHVFASRMRSLFRQHFIDSFDKANEALALMLSDAEGNA